MAPDREEPARGLAGRLRRVGEVLIALSGSPVPTHLFQTLEEQTQAVVPHDYLAVCLEDVERRGYLVHSLSALPGGEVGSRLFRRDEGLPGQAIHTGRAFLVGNLEAVPGAAADLDGALVRAGLRAALAVPVRRGLEVVGALLFARPGPAYDDEDLEVGTLLAAGLSAGLETCRAYQALADERSTLAAVLTSTADAVVMVGGDGLVLLANPGARAMLGLAPEAVIGRPLAEAIAHEPLRRLLEAGRPGTAELRLPDGRTAQASLVAVTTEYGEPVGLAAILRDITLLKELDQMKTDFVSTVSHDLKSPIMAIAMTAELLLSGAGGRVVVTVEAETAGDRRVRLRVSDNGIGIPARDLPHVFDKFYRVKSDATTGISGTGLGLAITRSIVEAHAGRLGVESREGEGSTFWVELPGAADGPAA
jgi:PAS domain S-box-containing protein